MAETAVNILLVANEADLSTALGTIEEEKNMRASLLRAMEFSGDKGVNKIIHSRQHMQQWGANALVQNDAMQVRFHEPKQFGNNEYQAGRSWISQASWDSGYRVPQQQLNIRPKP